MVCCLLCFSGEPVDDDPKSLREKKFQISLMDAVTKGQPCCIASCFCPCCAAYQARTAVLDNDMSKYVCCQGYISGCCCCKPGQVGEQSCPEFCLCLEAFCCVGPSMSTSRMYLMDKHALGYDPCDNKLIRFSNCLQILSCICNILAIFISELRELARLIQCIADLVFYSMMGCMSAQIQYEVEYQKTVSAGGYTDSTASPIVASAKPYEENYK
eukprot:CAMPEP_0185018120 /NCGR_PEP_ID=MMETSP1103-20130426/950_1 /TAXON_ID=36769 /ORGANISM="Paraphysomonas bandaiensis, Strain Caron Lab Isolate" /LENGTH=213 /DNA_ID=CAMNT_0027547833 /DNA_START=43 /DNA_END=684 /DNA_ORIENTATION=-